MTVVAEEKDLESTRGILTECDSEEIDREQLERTLGEFGGVLSDMPGCCRDLEMDIKLAEGSQPFALSPYMIPDRLEMGVKQEIEDLLSIGIIEESNAKWSSPLVPVVKDTGKIRLCVDYWKLNLLTPQVQYQMPSLDDILVKAGDAQVMSKLDLSKGFYQPVVEEESIDKTTFCSPFGKYRFKSCPLD